MKRFFLDTDIFVRDLRYPRDAKTEANQAFLSRVRSGKIKGATSIFNVLETCGILSYNLSAQDLVKLYGCFTDHYRLKIIYPADAAGNLDYQIPKIFKQIQLRQSLGDAEISYVVERFASQLLSFVSWNAPHFEGKLTIPVTTPDKVEVR